MEYRVEQRLEPLLVDQHYEDEFEFPLWKLIRECAEAKDISYSRASEIVVPEYVKTIRYGDREYEDSVIEAREKEMFEERARSMADRRAHEEAKREGGSK
jgi:hypothetical protein